jgi:hypothetical protein
MPKDGPMAMEIIQLAANSRVKNYWTAPIMEMTLLIDNILTAVVVIPFASSVS